MVSNLVTECTVKRIYLFSSATLHFRDKELPGLQTGLKNLRECMSLEKYFLLSD